MDEIEVVLLVEDELDRPVEGRCRVVGETDRAERPGNRRNVPPRHLRVAAGEGRDLAATPVELNNQLADDPLGSPVTDRRDGFQGRSNLGDPQRLAGPTPYQ